MAEQPGTALEAFSKWSNYLLVTTVAALGWIATGHGNLHPAWARSASLWLLALSAIFGVLALALVPLLAEQQSADATSIYKTRIRFSLFGLNCSAFLTQACRPQHLSFMIGILLYGGAAAGRPWVGMAIALALAAHALVSRPRETVRRMRSGPKESAESL